MKSASPKIFRYGAISFRWRPRTFATCLLLFAFILAVGVLLLGTGTLAIKPMDVIATLSGAGSNQTAERVIMRIRLPRLLTAFLVGSALGMAGSIFQSISRNPLGSPDIIGFTTGAATGAIMQIILFDAGPIAVSLAAVASGGLTAAIAFLLTIRKKGLDAYRLVLIGIGIGATLSGINTVLLVMGDLDQAASAHLWLAGSLNTRTWSHVVPAAIGVAIAIPVAIHHGRILNMIEMGDDAALQLGVHVDRARLTTMLAAVWLTAVATAAAGPIAFIALAAPQISRRLTAASGVPLFSAALIGALLLLTADMVSQNLPIRINMPIGLTTGLFGGLYLLWLLQSRKAH